MIIESSKNRSRRVSCIWFIFLNPFICWLCNEWYSGLQIKLCLFVLLTICKECHICHVEFVCYVNRRMWYFVLLIRWWLSMVKVFYITIDRKMKTKVWHLLNPGEAEVNDNTKLSGVMKWHAKFIWCRKSTWNLKSTVIRVALSQRTLWIVQFGYSHIKVR